MAPASVCGSKLKYMAKPKNRKNAFVKLNVSETTQFKGSPLTLAFWHSGWQLQKCHKYLSKDCNPGMKVAFSLGATLDD